MARSQDAAILAAGLRRGRAESASPRASTLGLRKASSRLAQLAEIVLALALAMIAAQVVALFFAPLPPIERAPAGALRSGPDSALPSAGSASANPFRIARAGPVGSGPGAGATRLEESALNLKLYGAWRGPGGARAAMRKRCSPKARKWRSESSL